MDQSPNDQDVPAPAPVQELIDCFAVMERLLADLSLRLPINPSPPPEPAAPVAPVHQVPEAHHGMVIRNRRYNTVLAVSTYRLRDQILSLRPDQMTSLSGTAALLRPLLEGSIILSGSPPLAVLPFLSQVVRVANQTQIHEAALLWLLGDFLKYPAKEASRIQVHDKWPM
jgi:hypothetical protein